MIGAPRLFAFAPAKAVPQSFSQSVGKVGSMIRAELVLNFVADAFILDIGSPDLHRPATKETSVLFFLYLTYRLGSSRPSPRFATPKRAEPRNRSGRQRKDKPHRLCFWRPVH